LKKNSLEKNLQGTPANSDCDYVPQAEPWTAERAERRMDVPLKAKRNEMQLLLQAGRDM